MNKAEFYRKIAGFGLFSCLFTLVGLVGYLFFYKDYEFKLESCANTNSFTDAVQRAKWDGSGNLIVTVATSQNCGADTFSGDYRVTFSAIYFNVSGYSKSGTMTACNCSSLGHFTIRNLVKKEYKLAMEGKVPWLLLRPDNTIATASDIDDELLAAMRESMPVKADFLKGHGAKMDLEAALFMALEKGEYEFERFASQYETDIPSNLKNALLLEAAKIANEKGVQLLIKNGADVNVRNAHGQTPLILAISNINNYNPLGLIRVLVEAGADIHAKDDAGRNAVLYAMKYGEQSPVQYLIEKGADVTVVDKAGKTARDIARFESKSRWRYPTLVYVLPILENACHEGNIIVCKSISEESIPSKVNNRTVYRKLGKDHTIKFVNDSSCSKKPEHEAASCFRLECEEKRDLEGCHTYAFSKFREGKIDEAEKYYGMACRNEHYDSCSWLALIKRDRGNLPESLRLYRDLCRRGREQDCEMVKRLEAKK